MKLEVDHINFNTWNNVIDVTPGFTVNSMEDYQLIVYANDTIQLSHIDNCIFRDDSGYTIHNVTHWMLLSKPN